MTNPVASLITADALKAGIDPRWALAEAQTESGLNPNARNPSGATGVMQLMPQTAQALGVNPANLAQNVQGGVDLLAQNLKRYGNPERASAAYFGGTNPANWGPKTRAYVQKVASNYQKDGKMNGPTPLQQLLAKAQAEASAPPQPGTPAPTSANASASPLSQLLAKAQSQVKAQQAAQKPDNLVQDFVSGAVKSIEGIGSLGDSPQMNRLQNTLGVKRSAIPAPVQAIETQANATQPKSIAGIAAQGAGGFMAGLPLGGEGDLISLGKQAAGLGAAGAASAIGQHVAGPVGALVGAFAPAAGGALAGKAVDVVAGPTLSPERAQLARDYQALGGKLGGTEVSASPFLKYLDSTAKHLPLMGSTGHDEAIQNAFNRAVSTQMGTPADKITPKVMDATKTRLGNEFDQLAAQIPIHADDQLLSDLSAVETQAGEELPESTMKPINKQLNDVLSAVGPDGQITGAQYQALTRKGTPLMRAMDSTDPNVRHYAGQIREALDSAMERSAPPELLGRLQKARYQYKVMKTIEPLVQGTESGNISPARLKTNVAKSFKNLAYDGAGPMGTLARAGQAFFKEAPNSGTAQRELAINLLTGGALADLGYHAVNNPELLAAHGLNAGTALLGAGAMRGALGAARSESAANWLLNRAENPAAPQLSQAMRERLLIQSAKNPSQQP